MSVPNEIKVPPLRAFHEKLHTKDFAFHGCAPDNKDRAVLEEFPVILEELDRIKPVYKEIIVEITRKMGDGMADYVSDAQFNVDGVDTNQDYRQYCHHVAGLVGDGLTQMAVVSNFATQVLKEKPELYENMGQFLQRTNIIRDFQEDLNDKRSFWPRETYSKYVDTLSDLAKPENSHKALHCLSDMVALSLELVPDVLEYLANLTETSYFRFCAIPQVMSIATLELLFNNPKVFHSHLKIRRGLTAKLILHASSLQGVHSVFLHYARAIHLKNKSDDPNFLRIELLCAKIEQTIQQHSKKPVSPMSIVSPKTVLSSKVLGIPVWLALVLLAFAMKHQVSGLSA